jgi:hypothetical protein
MPATYTGWLTLFGVNFTLASIVDAFNKATGVVESELAGTSKNTANKICGTKFW